MSLPVEEEDEWEAEDREVEEDKEEDTESVLKALVCHPVLSPLPGVSDAESELPDVLPVPISKHSKNRKRAKCPLCGTHVLNLMKHMTSGKHKLTPAEARKAKYETQTNKHRAVCPFQQCRCCGGRGV